MIQVFSIRVIDNCKEIWYNICLSTPFRDPHSVQSQMGIFPFLEFHVGIQCYTSTLLQAFG